MEVGRADRPRPALAVPRCQPAHRKREAEHSIAPPGIANCRTIQSVTHRHDQCLPKALTAPSGSLRGTRRPHRGPPPEVALPAQLLTWPLFAWGGLCIARSCRRAFLYGGGGGER